MFAGLIEAHVEVVQIENQPEGIRLTVQRPQFFDDVQIGDSIAIQGCCLTVVDLTAQLLGFQAGRETLSRTNLGKLTPGHRVNIERSLRLGDRIGGHLVTGHVDGLGIVVERHDRADWSDVVFDAPVELLVQMASKGSITVDGVSLTLVQVSQTQFSVALIPHTLSATTLGSLQVGDRVHLETDVLAKYVQRQLETTLRTEKTPQAGSG